MDETNADKARYNAAADRIAERQRKGITPSAKDLAELSRLESVLKGSREAINRRLGQGGRLGAAAVVGSAVLGSSMVAGEAEAATAAEEEVQQAPAFSREEYRPASRRHRVSK
ncbi:MAG: hypothetical protein IPJ84_12650 [Bdellovibrionales bacterium]|nr:hypothetical protein [Bdellovibrionales bacterium]